MRDASATVTSPSMSRHGSVSPEVRPRSTFKSKAKRKVRHEHAPAATDTSFLDLPFAWLLCPDSSPARLTRIPTDDIRRVCQREEATEHAAVRLPIMFSRFAARAQRHAVLAQKRAAVQCAPSQPRVAARPHGITSRWRPCTLQRRQALKCQRIVYTHQHGTASPAHRPARPSSASQVAGPPHQPPHPRRPQKPCPSPFASLSRRVRRPSHSPTLGRAPRGAVAGAPPT